MKSLILALGLAGAPILAISGVLPSQALAQTAAPAVAQTAPPHMPADLSPAGVRAADGHLALEEVEGTEALAFLAAENARSLEALTGDPRYETMRAEAEAILTATDRVPGPSFLGNGIGNFWQDGANPKGIWRRTSLDSYRSGSPVWETLLDMDALARSEGKDWVFKGADCLAPDETRCLILLSDGGKDAVVVREFDTESRTFVEGGFSLAEGKHRLEWLDSETLLVATDFGQGSLTESGYPYIVRALKRGSTLEASAELFRGNAADGGYGVSPSVYRDGEGNLQAVIFNRPLDTFRSETWWLDQGNLVKLAIPERVSVHGVMGGRLVFTLDEAWNRTGLLYGDGERRAGSLMAVSLNTLRPRGSPSDPVRLTTEADVIVSPTARQSINAVRVFDDRVVATIYDNVVGHIVAFTSNGSGPWLRTVLPAADNVSVNLGSSSRKSARMFYNFEGFLTPSTLALVDLRANSANVLRTAPARFEASTHLVEQFQATSADGTRVPYFVVRPRAAPLDGTTPTLMFGYGGFQISFPPTYRPELGKLWLERGGAYVVANIRGGGEFGPAWHQAALKGDRQRSFDDFAAVGRDLIERGITSSRRLGIYGRSNGGVLTSVAVTQNPDLFNAVVIESPLVDMLRYPDLPAGASWIGEYGDPRIPEEAAWIARYSGYQNLRTEANYPRMYITTNTRDDRVHPGHARKFAARLGAMGYDRLYYEETAGGHSNEADPLANARRWARHYTYLAQQLMD